MQAYEGVMQLEEDINPIQKRRLVVYNVGAQLIIDEEGNPVQVGEGQCKANMNNMAGGMQTVTAQFAAVCQENIDLRELPYMLEIKHWWRLSTNHRFSPFFFDIVSYLEYWYVLLLRVITM